MELVLSKKLIAVFLALSIKGSKDVDVTGSLGNCVAAVSMICSGSLASANKINEGKNKAPTLMMLIAVRRIKLMLARAKRYELSSEIRRFAVLFEVLLTI